MPLALSPHMQAESAADGNVEGASKKLATSPNLCFSPLAALNKMGNSVAITHFIAPCYERKSTSFDLTEVFRGPLK